MSEEGEGLTEDEQGTSTQIDVSDEEEEKGVGVGGSETEIEEEESNTSEGEDSLPDAEGVSKELARESYSSEDSDDNLTDSDGEDGVSGSSDEEEEPAIDLERQRQLNIERNKRKLAELGFVRTDSLGSVPDCGGSPSTGRKRKRVDVNRSKVKTGKDEIDENMVAQLRATMVGRSQQIETLAALMGGVMDPTPPIFLSGPPSTGKTAVMKGLVDATGCPFAYIDCKAISSPQQLFRGILAQLVEVLPLGERQRIRWKRKKFNKWESTCPPPDDEEGATGGESKDNLQIKGCRTWAAFTRALYSLLRSCSKRASKTGAPSPKIYLMFDRAEALLPECGCLKGEGSADALKTALLLPRALPMQRYPHEGDTLLQLSGAAIPYIIVPILVSTVSNLLTASICADSAFYEAPFAQQANPVSVYFPSYSSEDLEHILLKFCGDGEGLDAGSDERGADANTSTRNLSLEQKEKLKKLVKALLGVARRHTSDLRRLDGMLRGLWRYYMKSGNNKEDVTAVVKSYLVPLVAGHLSQRETVYDPAPAKPSPALQLPLLSKYLLIAAFLASERPSEEDITLYAAKSKGAKSKKQREQEGSSTVTATATMAKSTGAKAGSGVFPLERLISIFSHTVTVALPSRHAARTSNISLIGTIATLVRLNLLSEVRSGVASLSPSYRCHVGVDVAQSIAKEVSFPLATFLSK